MMIADSCHYNHAMLWTAGIFAKYLLFLFTQTVVMS